MKPASQPSISLIVAHDESRGIGRNGAIPWHIPGELRWVRQITLESAAAGCENALIMGRSTYESLPENRRPLPGRMNIVISQQDFPGTVAARSLDQAVSILAESAQLDRAYIFGGQRLYTEALANKIPEELFISLIPGSHDCDVFFPEVSEENYRLQESRPATYGEVTVMHQRFIRTDLLAH